MAHDFRKQTTRSRRGDGLPRRRGSRLARQHRLFSPPRARSAHAHRRRPVPPPLNGLRHGPTSRPRWSGLGSPPPPRWRGPHHRMRPGNHPRPCLSHGPDSGPGRHAPPDSAGRADSIVSRNVFQPGAHCPQISQEGKPFCSAHKPMVNVTWAGFGSWAPDRTGERVLLTLVFTDIVGSTQQAVSLGDRAWREVYLYGGRCDAWCLYLLIRGFVPSPQQQGFAPVGGRTPCSPLPSGDPVLDLACLCEPLADRDQSPHQRVEWRGGRGGHRLGAPRRLSSLPAARNGLLQIHSRLMHWSSFLIGGT